MIIVFARRPASSLLLILFDGLKHLICWNSTTVIAADPGHIYKSLTHFSLFQPPRGCHLPADFIYTFEDVPEADQYSLLYGRIIELKFYLAYNYQSYFQVEWESIVSNVVTLVRPTSVFDPGIRERELGLDLIKKIADDEHLVTLVCDQRFILACCEMMSDQFNFLGLREKVLDCLLALSRADETSAAVIVTNQNFTGFRPDPSQRKVAILFCEIWENMIYELSKCKNAKADFRRKLFEKALNWAQMHIRDIVEAIKELLDSDEFHIMCASTVVLAALVVSFGREITVGFPIDLNVIVARIVCVLEAMEMSCFGRLCRALCVIASFMNRNEFLEVIRRHGAGRVLRQYVGEELNHEDGEMLAWLCNYITSDE
jgi:hypothetical protein